MNYFDSLIITFMAGLFLGIIGTKIANEMPYRSSHCSHYSPSHHRHLREGK